MYLSNVDLKKILSEMEFDVPDANHPFDPSEQIQLCSIDLRVANTFWRQKSTISGSIDLRKSALMNMASRRHWEEIVLKYGECITLKSGEFILAHTFEKFKIPKGYAGKICSKSTFARLGIDTICSTDFINPGWRGHVPIELINNSRFSVKIYPLLSMSQLMLIPLSSEPDGEYRGMYYDDDGGPGFWWRDKMFKKMIATFGKSIQDKVVEELIEKLQPMSKDDNAILRLDNFLDNTKLANLGSAEVILHEFCKREKRRKKIREFRFWFLNLLSVGTFSFVFKQGFFFNENRTLFLIAAALFLVAISITAYFNFIKDKKEYYDNLTK